MFFRQKENDTRWKSGSAQRDEEHWKCSNMGKFVIYYSNLFKRSLFKLYNICESKMDDNSSLKARKEKIYYKHTVVSCIIYMK